MYRSTDRLWSEFKFIRTITPKILLIKSENKNRNQKETETEKDKKAHSAEKQKQTENKLWFVQRVTCNNQNDQLYATQDHYVQYIDTHNGIHPPNEINDVCRKTIEYHIYLVS